MSEATSASNGFLTTQVNDATTEMISNLLSYGEDQLVSKYPDAIDGLKVSTRRIIWCARKFPKPEGFSKLVGAIADIHVGGDSSIEEAIVRLGQNFKVGHPLISIEGKSGEYYDPKAYAAPRYLKAGISNFAMDVFFNGINQRTLPLVPTKDFSGREPRYLIPRLPMALIIGNLTIGYAFKSEVPMVDISDVCDLVMEYAKFYKEGGRGIPAAKILAPHLVPAFPVRNLIKNRQEVLGAYSVGDYNCPIKIEGWAEICYTSITFRAVPYGVDFGTVTSDLRQKMRDRKHQIWDYIDSANQLSSSEAEFTVTVKRGRNPFEVFEKLKTYLKYNKTWTPLANYVVNGRVDHIRTPELVAQWYRERAISIRGGLKYRHESLMIDKLKYEALLAVIDNADDVIDIVRKSANRDDAMRNLHQRFTHLTRQQTYVLAGMQLADLNKGAKKNLQEGLERTIIALENTVNDFNRINEKIYEDAARLKVEYKSTNLTKYSDDFIGYVRFGKLGVVQFFDNQDLIEILATKWPATVTRSIHLYDPKFPRRYLVKQRRLCRMDDDSRIIMCENLVCYPAAGRDELTLYIDNVTQKTSVLQRDVPVADGDVTICPITKDFYAIYRNGTIAKENYQNFTLRKTATGGAKTEVLYGLPIRTKDVVVFHMNTEDNNIIYVDRILTDPDNLGRLRTTSIGTTRVLGVYPFKTQMLYLNIPADCRKNSVIEFLYLEKVADLFKNARAGETISINITKNSKHCRLVRDGDVRALSRLVMH